jgi:hypothetical protein
MLPGIALLVGCVQITMVKSWKDESFTGGPLRHMLVLAVASNEPSRRSFEDRVGQELAARGVKAVSSFRILPDQNRLEKEVIESKLEATEITAVLVGQIINRRTETVEDTGTTRVEPPMGGARGRGGWHGGYSRGWEVTHDPTVTRDREVVTVETSLFEVKSDALIWSASFEAVLEPPLDPLIAALATKVVDQLAADGFVP